MSLLCCILNQGQANAVSGKSNGPPGKDTAWNVLYPRELTDGSFAVEARMIDAGVHRSKQAILQARQQRVVADEEFVEP